MGSSVSPAFIAAVIITVPIVVAMIGEILADISRERRDKADGVVASWAGLRITRNQLVMGYHPDAKRIPLAGLSADVEQTGSPVRHLHDRRVHLTIELPGDAIDRWQPYSCGTCIEAQKFAIAVNQLSHNGALHQTRTQSTSMSAG
jgi:hypothetical protein